MNLLAQRPDLAIIADWIKPESRVLDLGCGDGTLMHHLLQTKGVNGYGVDIADSDVVQCISHGINIIQMDLNLGLAEFDEDSFDHVILSMTLQAMHRPDLLLKEMMRVGNEGIVTFPNFGHWKSRLNLVFGGHMPVTRSLPNEWYNTPNIHLCTLSDFERLCDRLGFRILERQAVDHSHRGSFGLKILPNLLGEVALYRFRKK
ncbi:MAG: methionine biosynthesis protein MetW [Gammaproteobacteria bacterium]|nr:methionine biosynthesis protein MetW [Gammaproteobacteria bacterium]